MALLASIAGCASKPVLPAPPPATSIPLFVHEFPGHCLEYRLDARFDGHAVTTKFDTGASDTMVPLDPFFRAYAEKRATTIVSGSGVPMKSSVIPVKDVRAAGVALDLPEVVRLGTGKIRYATLGMSALSKHSFAIDFPARRLELNPVLPKGELKPLTVSDAGKLVIEAVVAGETVPAMVDTGYCYSVAKAELIAKHPGSFTLERHDELADATGRKAPRRFFRLKEFRYGPVKIENALVLEDRTPLTKVNGKEVPFALGAQAMSPGRWYFDVPGKAWGVSL